MTKEKWTQSYDNEMCRLSWKVKWSNPDPTTWAHNRKNFMEFIETMDEATEVHNMENKGK